MRAIDAEALIESLLDYAITDYDREFVKKVKYAVDRQPTIEPEIIRCEKCLHWQENIFLGHRCNMLDWTSKNNDFCSLAKRREDE